MNLLYEQILTLSKHCPKQSSLGVLLLSKCNLTFPSTQVGNFSFQSCSVDDSNLNSTLNRDKLYGKSTVSQYLTIDDLK